MEETLAAMFDRATHLMKDDHQYDALNLIQQVWDQAEPGTELFAQATRILALQGLEHVAALMPDQPDGNEREYRKALAKYRPVFDAMFEIPDWPRLGLN